MLLVGWLVAAAGAPRRQRTRGRTSRRSGFGAREHARVRPSCDRRGADWVEIDVQETADGEVIVIHDSDFMKLAGVDLKVWDATFEQARTIDIGGWFDPEFAGERVPTLREVLETARGRSHVVIE